MAQLNDTMVQGDLRVTGKVYGTDNAIHLENANLAIPMIGNGDYVGSSGDFFIGSGSGKNLPDTTNNFNIHTTVAHFTGTIYRLSQIATPTSSSNPTGIYERGGISSDGVNWTFSSWMAAANSSHTHGNITNGGALQTNDITIANGDKLVVTDSSDSNKVARTSVSFDGSTTTKALTQKGTFESFAKAGDITTAIQALDVSSVGGAGKYISAILETDGKISATATTMDTTPTASSTKAVTSGGIKTALDGKQDALSFMTTAEAQLLWQNAKANAS